MLKQHAIWVVLITLLAGSLACNLSRASDQSEDNGTSPTSDVAAANRNITPPTVQIFTPADGQQVIVNSPVDVRVNATHDIGVQRLQMAVDGNIVSSKSLLENPTDVEVLLTWTPDRRGSFTLEIQAFHGGVGSETAAVTLQVFPEGTILDNPAVGQATEVSPSGACTGRIMISNLNSRSGPGTSFSKQGKFDVGETVAIIGRNASTRNQWYKIRRDNDDEVWVISNPEWVETSGNCANLPTVE